MHSNVLFYFMNYRRDHCFVFCRFTLLLLCAPFVSTFNSVRKELAVAPLASRFVCCSLYFSCSAAARACNTFKINELKIFLFHFSSSDNVFAASRNKTNQGIIVAQVLGGCFRSSRLVVKELFVESTGIKSEAAGRLT